METIRVNMTPCEDVQTIHASQNDGEARQWGFELHNNGEKIDSSSISDQMVFKAYEGGTEQILPENGSVPTTAPFLGDIRYPQGLLSDQEFLYRESPTEEDGLAKITDIKGNTLVWNQLAKATQSFTSATSNGITLSRVDDHLHIQGTATDTATFNGASVLSNDLITFVRGHKYFLSINSKNIGVAYGIQGYGFIYNEPSIAIVRDVSADSDWRGRFQFRVSNGTTVNSDIYLQAIDLTQMGLDITASDFTSLFSLPYYDYNQGTLLSFMGNGIKTTGKNLFNGAESYSRDNAGYYIREGETNSPLPLKLAKGTYTISIKSTVAGTSQLELFSGGTASSDRIIGPYISLVVGVKTYTFTIDKQCNYIRLYGNFVGTISDIQIEYGSTATEYEPYTSSTLSLPISTYFPNGMKSAGSVYDELTETKAITRVGAVDLGSLSWVMVTSGLFQALVNDLNTPTNNLLCKYTTENYSTTSANMPDKSIKSYGTSATKYVYLKDSAYSTVESFKSAMSGVYLYYELATESETTFSTASLVTENAEIPLSNEDGVLVGKCIEELSENPGFFDAKIKLADEDGECYSNKLQLHIERSPQ